MADLIRFALQNFTLTLLVSRLSFHDGQNLERF